MAEGRLSDRTSAEVVEEARPHLEEARQAGELSRVAGELLSMARVLTGELRLRRTLADPSLPEEVKRDLLGGLLGDRARPETLTLLNLVVVRRLRPVHMVDLVEQLGAQAVFAQAQADETLDDVEDELFRFARLIEREPRLRMALGDATLPVERKTELVDALLRDRAQPATLQLVQHVLAAERGRAIERALERLAELAAAQRGRLVAEVITARTLTPSAEERLREQLATLKGRPVDLQITVDPSIMGGVIVRIGEEQYDGSARRQLERLRERFA